MQVSNQEKIAFFLTGRRSGTDLKAIDGSYRPALFARYADLTSLRYDLPLVLNFDERPDRAVLSLSGLIDDAVGSLAADADRDRFARHGYAIEQEIRKLLSEKISADFAELWNAAVVRLAQNGAGDVAASANILWKCFDASGTIIDADEDLSSRVLFHAWKSVQENKTSTFRQKAKRLLLKLHGILEAEFAASAEGRAPERLRAAIGSTFSSAFDFDEMSRILDGSKPSFALSDQRRNRIKGSSRSSKHSDSSRSPNIRPNRTLSHSSGAPMPWKRIGRDMLKLLNYSRRLQLRSLSQRESTGSRCTTFCLTGLVQTGLTRMSLANCLTISFARMPTVLTRQKRNN